MTKAISLNTFKKLSFSCWDTHLAETQPIEQNELPARIEMLFNR